MANKILVAVDESKNALRAVRYVAESMKCETKITLLSILPDPTAACELDAPSLAPVFKESRQTFCALEDTKRERVQTFLNECREALIQAGFRPADVVVKMRKKKRGIARDILKEARDGGYDTIVVGRRGLSGVKDFLFGSVSNKILQMAEELAVVVID